MKGIVALAVAHTIQEILILFPESIIARKVGPKKITIIIIINLSSSYSHK